MNRLVVVDSDTLVFSSAAVCEKRLIDVTHKPTGIIKSFENRTKFKSHMEERGKEITEDYIITDRQEAEPLPNTLNLIKRSADKILEKFEDDKVIFVAGDVDNFRLDLPLPVQYKSNRKEMMRPVWLKESHEYFKNRYKARKARGYEADDLVSILANEGIREGKEVIVSTPDKDARQTIGANLYNYQSSSDSLVLIEDFHPITMEKGKAKSYGVPWICLQLVLGDPTDCYKPTQLANVKYGDVSAFNDFKDLKTAQESLLKVIEKYKEWYPDKFEYKAWDGVTHEATWESMLQLYFSCVKMKTSEKDELIAGEFFAQYGVDL